MNREGIGKREKYSGAVVLSVGIISQQGANLTTRRVASRIALFQITIHSWIMYNYYSASIVSARLSEPLDMMEDSVTVLADSKLKIAAEAVPYLNYFLYKLNWESDYFRKKRWDPLPESKRYLPIEEGIKQVSQGILAYHTDPNTAYPYVERMFDSNKICELTEIHLFKQSVMGMYASHNGQFIEIAKIGLTKMFNTGLRDRQIKQWSSRKPQCQPDTLSTRSITIYETAPALILLALGIPLADDIEIIKVLNDAGILVSIKRLDSNIDVSRFLETTYWKLGVFMDLRCPFADSDAANIFYEASAHYMFDHLHNWLILEENGRNVTETMQSLNDSTFSIITDFVISISKDDECILYDVYNHCKHCGGSLNVVELGTWTRINGLNVDLLEDKFTRRWNYNKLKVKAAGIVTARPKDQDLLEYLQQQDTALVDNWSKFGYSMLIEIAAMFNLTNGPLMAGLKQRDFDVGYFPSILTNDRLNYANVALQVWPARTCFMFRTVPSLITDMNLIFRPFETTVWYMVCLLSIVIISTLWLIWKVHKQSDYGESTLILIAALCQQAMVSSRLNVPLNKMNDSLYSLVKSKIKLVAHKEVFFNVLINSPAPDVQYFRRHWEAIPEEKRFEDLDEGVRRILKPGFAYLADPIVIYPLIERIFTKQMICQLTEVHLLRPSSLGMWTARHGQFHEITKIGLIRITTSGIRHRQVKRWYSRKPYCDMDKHYVSSVTIRETIPFILLLLVGILLSIIICLIENMVF
ncbi:hypothetical protein WN55_00069, partial [Dufourea novaeangliae]